MANQLASWMTVTFQSPNYAFTLCCSLKKAVNFVKCLKVSQINFDLSCVTYKRNHFWTKELKSAYTSPNFILKRALPKFNTFQLNDV
jgi:hypothetical protein